jgi:hypothetical protein
MGVWSSCSESLESSLCSVSAARASIVPLLDVHQLTIKFVETLICVEVKLLLVFRFYVRNRFCIRHSSLT